MDLLQAAALGILQGLTEFLPISSSGHLVLAHTLLGWQTENDLTFDVALHLGTLAAVLTYFAREIFQLVVATVRSLLRRSFADPLARLGLCLIVGTLPGVVAGVLLESAAERAFRDPRLVALMLLLFSGVMWLAERLASQKRSLVSLRLMDALVVGAAQAVALVPGVSRSGITISAGLVRGIARADAARFSFLLAAPITAGAAVLQLTKLALSGIASEMVLPFLVGIVSSAIVGFLCIVFLLRFLSRFSLRVFIAYRVLLALIVLVIAWPRG
ncbi:MAG: undecaprenyl-diphosphatase UppP [Chloroflexi bacterium]|nr:undecaprenyl-diphosphatase UppP [Chloroflexota bacterium]